MSYLPYDLLFCHRFNLHKNLGFPIDENDLDSIAGIYGVSPEELKKADEELKRRTAEAAETVKSRLGTVPTPPAGGYLALGDSITSDRASYAKIIRHLWNGENVIDAGISGDTTADVIDRFYADVMANRFGAATIFIGTNDSRGIDKETTMTRVGIADYQYKLRYFIEKMKSVTPNVILITLPPVDNNRLLSYFGDEANWHYSPDHLREMNKTIRKTAKKTGAAVIDLAEEIEKRGTDPLDVDGIHLTLEAQTLLAEMVLRQIERT